MVKFESVGMDPDLAANYAVHLIDRADTKNQKVKTLLNNTRVPLTSAQNTPKSLQSGQSVDIYVGELLGLAMAGMFYNWAGEGGSHTYQVVVGVEDSQKSNIENVLSDGAIWDNTRKERMVFQQVTVQGYYPEKSVSSSMVAEKIADKVKVRYRYPDACGLIVNIYSQEGAINFKEITKQCDLSSYTIVLVNWYQLPQVDKGIVYHLNPVEIAKSIPPKSLTINLARHPIDDEWKFNFDDALHKNP